MEGRPVVLLSPGGVPEGIVAALASGGWEVRGAGHGDAHPLIGDSRAAAGLVVLSEAAAAQSAALGQTLRQHGDIEWVALCDPGVCNRGCVRRLILDWCFDHLTLPVEGALLLHTVGHAYGRAGLRREQVRDDTGGGELPDMVARSRVMALLGMQVRRVAGNDFAVLIGGESGTGKELVARAIHRRSARAGEHFVAINCGGLPSSLVQSELFGSEKGAYTGAAYSRKGLLESARGGTVFLDEIGDLPLDQQANLLRFLETKTLSRLGSTASIEVDVRMIAATHVDLPAAVREGRFRDDLYHRLNVLSLRVPALRERREDIEPLAQHFFRRFSAHQGKARGFSIRALRAMLDHGWPGNVRELMNRVNRAVVLSEGPLVSPEDLGLKESRRVPVAMNLDMARHAAEAEAIRACLLRNTHNISHAARELGVSRVTLYRLLAKHGIQPHGHDEAPADGEDLASWKRSL